MGRASSLAALEGPMPQGSAQVVVDEATVLLPLAGIIELAAERTRLDKDRAKAEAEAEKVRRKLDNQDFVARAKPEGGRGEPRPSAGARGRGGTAGGRDRTHQLSNSPAPVPRGRPGDKCLVLSDTSNGNICSSNRLLHNLGRREGASRLPAGRPYPSVRNQIHAFVKRHDRHTDPNLRQIERLLGRQRRRHPVGLAIGTGEHLQGSTRVLQNDIPPDGRNGAIFPQLVDPIRRAPTSDSTPRTQPRRREPAAPCPPPWCR